MAIDRRAYWIWMQQAFEAGSKKPARLDARYPGGVREFCEGGPRLWNTLRGLTDKETAALRDFSLSQAEARLEYAGKMGWQVLTPDCEKYPLLLKNIPAPPAVLYIKGDMPPVDDLVSVSVVGSRHAGPEIGEVARRFGYQLAAGGACVVSGGAVGVDSAALVGAMAVPGSRFISVLPVSLDSNYLARNAKLRRMVCERGGALLSEHFSRLNPERGDFPVRNRLITGLSRGVVLVQAAEKSGTMLYASHALDQNRDVFVYPGPETSEQFSGSRRLLADGARAVTCGEDVLAEYGGCPPETPELRFPDLLDDVAFHAPEPTVPALADPAAPCSPQERQVLDALGREPSSVAELEEKTGMPASVLLGLLTCLEVEGLAESLPGKRYARAF